MIVSKTPLRVSLFGGGSDIPEFYENDPIGGSVISFAIQKYVYVFINKSSFDGYRISYIENEVVKEKDEIKNTRVKACLSLFPIIKDKLEIVTISDLPKRSGLGGSSAFTVGLLHALYYYAYKKPAHWRWLAQTACQVELGILKENIGKQDQYACAKGGLNYFKFTKNCVFDTKIENMDLLFAIEDHSYLYDLMSEIGHDASEILKSFDKKANPELINIRNISENFASSLLEDIVFANDQFYEQFVENLNNTWEHKKLLSNLISNNLIDNTIESLKENKMFTAGKLLGAGYSGFLFVYNPNDLIRNEIVQMPRIKIDHNGSQVAEI